MMPLLSTSDAARKLKISPIRVRQLIQNEQLPATRVGRDYVIDEADLAFVKKRAKPGRPKKDSKV